MTYILEQDSEFYDDARLFLLLLLAVAKTFNIYLPIDQDFCYFWEVKLIKKST